MKRNLAATITLLIFILLLISPALLLAKDNPYKSKSMKYGLPDFTVLAEKLTPVTVNIQTSKVIISIRTIILSDSGFDYF